MLTETCERRSYRWFSRIKWREKVLDLNTKRHLKKEGITTVNL
uniref:Uncharacterized protein n=1 Tax=Rhizophora mucronata TaxID=61149 RepID=A0A2P2PNK6_RHIMU